MTARAQSNHGSHEDHVLVSGVNWLGDAVMSMPALRLFKRERPGCRLTLLVKARMAELWRIADSVDEVVPYEPGLGGTIGAARHIRGAGCCRAYVLPNSFRSALIPFLGRIPIRIGVGTQLRSALLTETLSPASSGRHQAFEYLRVLGLDQPDEGLPPPKLSLPQQEIDHARQRLPPHENGTRWLGIVPGAARGPSKRWPPEHFIALGRALGRHEAGQILVFGSSVEVGLCGQIADAIGGEAVSMAGETTIPQLAALLGMCATVVTNDSGGMHLAAAAGARVVAVFGLTDPSRTGPLGEGHRVIAKQDVQASRDIRRRSDAAAACLRSIPPDRVLEAVLEVLGEK